MICDAFRPWLTPEERKPDPVAAELERLRVRLADTQRELEAALARLRRS